MTHIFSYCHTLEADAVLKFFKKNVDGIKKSCNFAARKRGTIAQLVEQRTENPCVAGSTPAGTTKTSAESSIRRLFSNV